MLAYVSRQNDGLGWPAANDNRPGAERVAEVASALRGVFPNITPIQAEQAAVQLTACGSRRDSRVAGARSRG